MGTADPMNATLNSLAKMRPPADAPASAWAARIAACWQASVHAIIEVGRLLTAAKDALPHGAFEAMIEADLPFSSSTARRLMAIGDDPRLSNRAHVHVLPPSWGTLYELTKLSDEEFERARTGGIIRPDMMRRDLEPIRLPAPRRASQPAPAPVPTADAAPAEPVTIECTATEISSTPLPAGSRAIMSSRIEPPDSLDFFPTPPWATRALMECVLPHLGIGHVDDVWEPACGEGHIAEVLREYARGAVIATDIHAYGYGQAPLDFLGDLPPHMGADWIITNPPFGDVTEDFVLKADRLARVGFAMFVRLQWLESVGRYEAIFRDNPPTLIAFFAERAPLCKGEWNPKGSTATAYIWLVWVKGQQPRAPFWIPPKRREALTRVDDAEIFTAHPVAKRQYVPRDPLTKIIVREDEQAVSHETPAESEIEAQRGAVTQQSNAEGDSRQPTTADVMPVGKAASPEPASVTSCMMDAGSPDPMADIHPSRHASAGMVRVSDHHIVPVGFLTPDERERCRAPFDDGLDIPAFLRRKPKEAA